VGGEGIYAGIISKVSQQDLRWRASHKARARVASCHGGVVRGQIGLSLASVTCCGTGEYVRLRLRTDLEEDRCFFLGRIWVAFQLAIKTSTRSRH